MDVLEMVFDTYHILFCFLSNAGSSITTVLSTVLKVNYDCVSSVFQVVLSVFNFIMTIGRIIAEIFYTSAVCVSDFVQELFQFLKAFAFLLWRVLVMVYYLVNLLFHMLEYLVFFVWDGGKWTAEALQISAHNLTENGLNTWKYFVVSLKEFSDSVIGGFAFIGHCGKTVGVFVIDLFTWCYECLGDVLFCMDLRVRQLCARFLQTMYSIITSIFLNTPKEVYLGIILCCVLYSLFRTAIKHLSSRGLTFPLFRHIWTVDDEELHDGYAENGIEFSDDDDVTFIDDSEDDVGDESSDETDESDEDDLDDDEELEVNTSDNESTVSGSEISEINIELPAPEESHHLRHSVTPCRNRNGQALSPDDLHREIENEKEKRMCIVCQDRNKSVLILPCKHMCLCVHCGNHIARERTRGRRVCPLCRTRIQTIMNIYV